MIPAVMHNHVDCPVDRHYGPPADYDLDDARYQMRSVARSHFNHTPIVTRHQQRLVVRSDWVLDQGYTELSPAYAWRHWLSSQPLPMALGPDVMTLVRMSQRYTPPGYETTIRACARALVDLGHIESFLWANNAEDVRRWFLSGFGPIVITAPWYSGFNDPVSTIAAPTGDVIAWHSFLINGYRKRNEFFYITNSHGIHWGERGRKKMRMYTLETLFDGGAIACGSPTKHAGIAARQLVEQSNLVVARL